MPPEKFDKEHIMRQHGCIEAEADRRGIAHQTKHCIDTAICHTHSNDELSYAFAIYCAELDNLHEKLVNEVSGDKKQQIKDDIERVDILLGSLSKAISYNGSDSEYLSDKHDFEYTVVADLEVLVSTSAPIKDTWSIPGKEVQTRGGGTQYYIGGDLATKQKIRTEDQIVADEAIKLLTDTNPLDPVYLDQQQRLALYKELAVNYDKASFMKSKGWDFSVQQARIESIFSALENRTGKDNPVFAASTLTLKHLKELAEVGLEHLAPAQAAAAAP